MRLSFPERRPAVIGIVSILIIAAGTTLAFSVNRFQGLRGVYEISADLTDAAGLQSGNEVRIAGVKVGRITKVGLTDTAARVTMEIAKDIRIPEETTLEVKLKTLLGQKFINLRFPKAYVVAASQGSPEDSRLNTGREEPSIPHACAIKPRTFNPPCQINPTGLQRIYNRAHVTRTPVPSLVERPPSPHASASFASAA